MNPQTNVHGDENLALNSNSNFNESWALYTKGLGLGILAVVIYVIASSVIGFIIEGITGFNVLTEQLTEEIEGISDPSTLIYIFQDYYANNLTLILLSRILTEFILLLTFPLAAGFILVCRELDLNGYAQTNTLFKGFKPEYWGRLMVLAIIYFIVSKIALMFFILPAVYIWVAACIACPYVLFQGMGGLEAFKASISTVHKNWFSVFKILLIASLFGIAGYFICGFGRIATYPFVLVSIYILYKNLVGFHDDTIDEIGQN